MFSGIQPSAYAVYAGMSLDAQLQVTKEMGMVFEYLNSPVVWSKFCATYDNIYLLMVEFDLFYLVSPRIGLPLPNGGSWNSNY